MVYIGLFILLHIPFFQEKLGDIASSYLSEYIGSPVKIKKIQIGFLNQAVINGVTIESPSGEQLLYVDKATTSFEILPILSGDINLSTIQVFGAEAKISRKTPESPLNIQYIIDKLVSKEDNKPKKEFEIGTLVIRNSNIKYDVLSEPIKNNLFDKNHLNIQDLELVCNLKDIHTESLNIDINSLRFKESNSALFVEEFSTNVTSTSKILKFSNPYIKVNNSSIKSNSLDIDTEGLSNGRLSITGNIQNSHILPQDFTCFIPSLKSISSTLDLCCEFTCVDNYLGIDNLVLTTDDHSLNIDGDIHIKNFRTPDTDIDTDIRNMDVDMEKMLDYLPVLNLENLLKEKMKKLGYLNLKGTINYNPTNIKTNTEIKTSIGDIKIDGSLKNRSHLISHISSKSISISKAFPEIPLNNTTLDLDVDMDITGSTYPQGLIKGDISHIEYADYSIDNIHVDGLISKKGYSGLLTVNDHKANGEFSGDFQILDSSQYLMKAKLHLNKFIPSALGIKSDLSNHIFDVDALVDIKGANLNDLSGQLSINKLGIHGTQYNYDVNDLNLSLLQNPNRYKEININSDIISGHLKGHYDYTSILGSVISSINGIQPFLSKDYQHKPGNDDIFDFDIIVNDNPFIHNFIKEPITIKDNIHLTGNVNTISKTATYTIVSPFVSYSGNEINNLFLTYDRVSEKFHISSDGNLIKDQKDVDLHLDAEGKGQMLSAKVGWKVNQEKPFHGTLNLTGVLNVSEDQLAHVTLTPSYVNIMDQEFQVESDYIDIYKDHINFKELKATSEDRSLEINGTLSSNPSDSLLIDLNGTTIGSFLKMANANAKNLDGYVYGNCNVYDILNSPRVNANLYIDDLMYKTSNLGHAYILANWDNKMDGIHISSNVMKDDVPDGLTSINGYIYPNQKNLDIKVSCQNTDASFLTGLLIRPFREITGRINGDIHINGPFNDINIQGAASADTKLTLRATSVTYSVSPEDSIRLTRNSFIFDNIHISDKDHHTNIINGLVTHENFKNFSYEFNMNLENMLLYEETTFNSDKFMGKVYGDGTFHLNGSDGHPLYITSDIYPAKGSEFSYDASSPDAITTNSFISFREIDPTDSLLIAIGVDPGEYWYHRDSLNNIETEEIRRYRGDVFMNLNIHMNHNCAVKLKMDNVEDGYITTYGTGVLHADYHNKGAFTLNGTYKIMEGKYRLYLQDIIYRDLLLQEGSQVVFNGNPFDADIHLICWHTLQSVPLSDLTSAVYTQNNRVRVICILDITGHLGNMNFQFDLNLPNVSDETRQIVRSYISTDEEMNKQLIYLLGFGRFYTNEYARANSDTNATNQAMNSLLSSTLSGQINQMLSNAIGNESKWNFGTGISTGERGWEDVDVEGTLSGKLLDDRLLINGNFGYRDNSMTNNSSFIGDFDVRWRLSSSGNTYLKAYNLTNDRYFTKSTLNTQGVGATYQRDFESWGDLFKSKKRRARTSILRQMPDTLSNVKIESDSIDFIKFTTDTLKH